MKRATMSSGHGIGRNRHRADQQSRSSHNTKITVDLRIHDPRAGRHWKVGN